MKFTGSNIEFEVGQKYRIVDIDAWWDKEKYVDGNTHPNGEQKFSNFEQVEVGVVDNCITFISENTHSQYIKSLVLSPWHDSCIKLITYEKCKQPDESDDTISLYHIADVLEDALNVSIGDESDYDKIKLCIKSLRKAGY